MYRRFRPLFEHGFRHLRAGRATWLWLMAGLLVVVASLNGLRQIGRAAAAGSDAPSAAQGLWQPLERTALTGARNQLPAHARAFRLNRAALAELLAQAPFQFTGKTRPALPLPLSKSRPQWNRRWPRASLKSKAIAGRRSIMPG
jgi:hypothetical protein